MNTEENQCLHLLQNVTNECQSLARFFVFSALQLFKILGCREDFAVVLATIGPPENCRRRLAFGPGGTPQEISRGQARASGRGPRLPRQTGHAPAGHRRSFWRRPPRTVSATTRRLGPVGPPASDQHSGPFLRYPAGARSDPERFPGAASAGADLPPANLLRRPSGTGTGRPRTDHGNHRRGKATPTHTVAAPPRCVHRVSVVISQFPTAWLRIRTAPFSFLTVFRQA